MYTAEFAWFEIDLPDRAELEAHVASPSPLFSNMRVGTRWHVRLGRFEIVASLDPVDGLHDLSRRAFEAREPGLTAKPVSTNGVPGMRYGDYGRAEGRIEQWYTLNGLTLALSLRPASGERTEPTADERAEHDALFASVRRIATPE
jgi:hypothetical protein